MESTELELFMARATKQIDYGTEHSPLITPY